VYAAQSGNKWFVVVDGKEEKQYDGIGDTPFFSPDSKHLIYVAMIGNKYLIVIDGKEEEQYNRIVAINSRWKTVFDTSDSFHYLASKGSSIYLVEERIK
jgi:hypothetical protein